ncbi:aminotransferase class-III protein [Rutstroemia sp. NJR-2017a BBW]|nr:aminotransferase class-III protein [Rutstroemia sp. NJR-2017a BBW]
MKRTTFSLDRHLHKEFPVVVGGHGSELYTKDGRTIFDATSGAAVSCLGHGNQRVVRAVCQQMASGIPYLASGFFGNETVDELCEELIKGTDHKMARVYLTGSGSEAMEATAKLARHQRLDGESDAAFVSRKAAELEAKFQELGPETVIGFVAEPIVGAALGCVAAVPGYLKAMRDVCHRHGALFILDEALEVQRIIRSHNVLDNVQKQGAYLGKLLKQRLGDHPNIGEIRGKGLFWGMEFVKDRRSKTPFEPKLNIAQKVHDMAISEPYNMTIYPGTGTCDGYCGDHVMLSPNYLVSKKDIEHIVQVTEEVVKAVFENVHSS